MKTSNKILYGLILFLSIIYIPAIFSFKSEYIRMSVRNIPDTFRTVVIEDDVITPDKITVTQAEDQKDTYAYYGSGREQLGIYVRYDNPDTLFFLRSGKATKETPLHLHLKGVDQVVLRDDVIYQR